MKNQISDLRNALFLMLENLSNPEADANIPQLIERAKAVTQVSYALIDTARVEIEYMRAMEAPAVLSNFIPTTLELKE